jgi:hypothetical protein
MPNVTQGKVICGDTKFKYIFGYDIFSNVEIVVLGAMVFNLVDEYQCFEETRGRKMTVTILLTDIGSRCC